MPKDRKSTPQSKRIGRNVQRLRRALPQKTGKPLTQEKLAEHVDISLRYVQEIEIGARTPSFKVLEALKKALKCSWDELLD